MTTKSTIGRRLAAPLLGGTLALTACGSDAGNASPSADTTVATSPAPVAESDAVQSSEEFCTALGDYIENAPGPDEEADPADFEAVVDASPPEIAENMQEMLKVMVQLSEFDEMTASGEEMADFEAAAAAFGPLADTAQAWSAENCPGVEVG